MIVSLRGNILDKKNDYIVIDVSGVGYKCMITSNTYQQTPDISKEVFLLTYHHIYESGMQLFGFKHNDEREIFSALISISGIGPKTAIQILSAIKFDDFKKRIMIGEVSGLSSIKGIGPKTAKRLIVELKDKFTDSINIEDFSTDINADENNNYHDAISALLALGYKNKDIQKVIIKIRDKKDQSVQDIIQHSLNELNK